MLHHTPVLQQTALNVNGGYVQVSLPDQAAEHHLEQRSVLHQLPDILDDEHNLQVMQRVVHHARLLDLPVSSG